MNKKPYNNVPYSEHDDDSGCAGCTSCRSGHEQVGKTHYSRGVIKNDENT